VASVNPSATLAPHVTSRRLVEHTIDISRLDAPENAALLAGCAATFCALGTTRGDAGSSEAFRRVDLEYVTASARASRAAGAPQFSLVSSAGANPKSWFLYPQTKGEAEEPVKALSFADTAIARPGLLGRGERMRTAEKFANWLMPVIPVETVARALRVNAEAALDKQPETAAAGAGAPAAGGAGSGAAPAVTVLDNTALYKLGAALAVAVAGSPAGSKAEL